MWPFKKEVLVEVIPEPEPQDEGLQKRFLVGQQLPWCGIWFIVTKVTKDKIELSPIRTTWQQQKKINKSKAGG